MVSWEPDFQDVSTLVYTIPPAIFRLLTGAREICCLEADGRAEMKNLLGGKGANLAEMASIGLPVPPGFTLTTEVCTHFYQNGCQYPKELEQQALWMHWNRMSLLLATDRELTCLSLPLSCLDITWHGSLSLHALSLGRESVEVGREQNWEKVRRSGQPPAGVRAVWSTCFYARTPQSQYMTRQYL